MRHYWVLLVIVHLVSGKILTYPHGMYCKTVGAQSGLFGGAQDTVMEVDTTHFETLAVFDLKKVESCEPKTKIVIDDWLDKDGWHEEAL